MLNIEARQKVTEILTVNLLLKHIIELDTDWSNIKARQDVPEISTANLMLKHIIISRPDKIYQKS